MQVKQQGVDAAEVVGEIVQGMLQTSRPVRLKDLEMQTGIASAKLHRYLVSMMRSGLVTKSADGSRYDFGLLAYRIGQLATHDQDELDLLEPFFKEFIEQLQDDDLGQAVGIGRWVGTGATMVKWFERESPLSIRPNPGVQLGITTSATAKLLAAYLPPELTKPLVQRELKDRGCLTNANVKLVFNDYAKIVTNSIANSIGARRTGLNALSTPLFDNSGKVVAAITILGMAPNFEARLDGQASELLIALGQQLSLKLGFVQSP
jgi:DNA-binding IclR family transcriptional regulator